MKKNKTNLEILSRRENFTARAVINGDTVIFVYEKSGNQVNGGVFSVCRSRQGDPEFTGEEVFGGSFSKQTFRMKENENYKMGDGVIYDEIYAICQSIMNPEPQEPQGDGTSV